MKAPAQREGPRMLRRAAMVFAVMFLLCLSPVRADQRWLVVSDTHLDPFARGSAPSFYGFDSNWPLFDDTLAQMRRVDANPAVVVIAGDFLAHHFTRLVHTYAPGQTVAAVELSTMAQIERRFAAAFPRSQFVIVLGNNDDPCGDYHSTPGTPYLAALARIWKPLVDRGGAAPAFMKTFEETGSYVARLPLANLRAVAVNSVYWSFRYRNVCGRPGARPAVMEMAWLRRTLRTTPRGVKNIVVMHIPPGIDPISTLFLHRLVVVPFLDDRSDAGFLQAVRAPGSHTLLVIAGHMHREDFRVAGTVPVLLAPSISPVYDNNPAFLSLTMRPNGALDDYRMHAYDLTRHRWGTVLDFDRTYGQSSVTAASLARVHRQIQKHRSVRRRWSSAFVADSSHHDAEFIDSGNWRYFWCAQMHFGPRYARCAGVRRRLAVVPVAAAVGGMLLIVLMVGLVLRLARQRRSA